MEPREVLPETLFEAEVNGTRYRVVKESKVFFALEGLYKDCMNGDKWIVIYACGSIDKSFEEPNLCCSILFRLLELMKRSKQLEYLDGAGETLGADTST